MRSFAIGCVAILLGIVGAARAAAPDALFPKPAFSQLPVYPERARTAHVAGMVKMRFLLNQMGEVVQITTISGNPLLSEPTVNTVKSWKFRPESIRPNVAYETDFVYVLKEQLKKGEPRLTVSLTDFRRVEVVSELYVSPIE